MTRPSKRSGTDIAFMGGMVKYILEEFIGLHRRAYAAAERRGQRAVVDAAEREVMSVPEEDSLPSEAAV